MLKKEVANMFRIASRVNRSAITLVGLAAILFCWTNGAFAFHLAKKRPKVIVVEQHHHHYHGRPRHVFRTDDDDDKHWKKRWRRDHHEGHRHGHHWRWHDDD
ncbi:MAG TPA: hypothetical protein VFM35_04790 [Candidatus Binatia bacterium]|nr:hypothetical protein [Candidatus Binatia bacterium]